MGKIKISTNGFEIINHSINLEHNGIVYPIRVVEEQVVVNIFSLGPKANLSSDGVKSDNEVMDGDVICLDERTNGIEYDTEQDSNSNLLSAVGDYVTPLVVETWAMQAKDDTTASYMIGNGEGGLEDVTAKELLDEVALVVK